MRVRTYKFDTLFGTTHTLRRHFQTNTEGELDNESQELASKGALDFCFLGLFAGPGTGEKATDGGGDF